MGSITPPWRLQASGTRAAKSSTWRSGKRPSPGGSPCSRPSSGMRRVRWKSTRSTASACTWGKEKVRASSRSSIIAHLIAWESLPLAVAHLAHQPQHRVVRQILQLAQQRREEQGRRRITACSSPETLPASARSTSGSTASPAPAAPGCLPRAAAPRRALPYKVGGLPRDPLRHLAEGIAPSSVLRPRGAREETHPGSPCCVLSAYTVHDVKPVVAADPPPGIIGEAASGVDPWGVLRFHRASLRRSAQADLVLP